jgi:hypothetical protein
MRRFFIRSWPWSVRDQTERHPGDPGDGKGERQHSEIQSRVEHDREVHGIEAKQCSGADHREEESDRSPGERHQHALRQELPDQPGAPRPHRHAHGDLSLPAAGPRQQQIRHVRAGDEEHESNGGEEDQQGGANGRDRLLVDRDDTRPDSRIGLGIGFGDPGGNRAHLRVHSSQIDSVFGAAQYEERVPHAVRIRPVEGERHPEIRL